MLKSVVNFGADIHEAFHSGANVGYSLNYVCDSLLLSRPAPVLTGLSYE